VDDVRAAALHDLAGVYRVCLATGDPDWDPAVDDRNQELLGHVYAGPYLVGQRSLARVVDDGTGVSGYLFGCEDTAGFEAWAEREWWPPLRSRYPRGSGRPADAELIELLYAPPRSPEAVRTLYPAHLHIDLLPRSQGRGLGRTLIEWLEGELRARRVAGLHLGVGTGNANAIAFYTHLGFIGLEDDGATLWMGKALW
jgi:GNAT superfamily N-acetyltransferase